MESSSHSIDNNAKVLEVYGRMRPYQQDVMVKMALDRRHLNYMAPGMGKTLVTMTAIMLTEAFPCIVICPKSAMGVWQEELKVWYGEESTIYVGKPKQRELLWKEFVTKGHKFIITNYALAKELGSRLGVVQATSKKGSGSRGTGVQKLTPHPGTGHKWNLGGIIADEIQLGGLFNHKSATYDAFKQLCRQATNVYLLTGTPYRRGVIDFYGPLSLVDPERFASYWKYVTQYCVTVDTGFGKSIERNPANAITFRTMLREYATILKKEDHLHELPGKIRQAIPVVMEDEQERVYRELTEELYAETDAGDLVMTPSILALSVRQRQLLVAPQELGLRTRGVAINTLLEMTADMVAANKPFVVFTPFKKAVRWIREALLEDYPDIHIFEITGGLTTDQFTAQWQGFQNFKKSAPSVLICVIKSGASFHSTRADTAFFLGYEWDFNQNTQSEDRLNRMGQKSLVTCYYLLHKNTIDEHVIQRLNEKQLGADLILHNEEDFQKLIAKRKR